MSGKIIRRNTPQRQLVLSELKALHSHPTATELYDIVRRKMPTISLGTVYRNLEFLAKEGLIRKLEIPGHEARFDGEVGKHSHVRCVHCGRVSDIEGDFEISNPESSDARGYQVTGYQLEFIGTCPECAAMTEDEREAEAPS